MGQRSQIRQLVIGFGVLVAVSLVIKILKGEPLPGLLAGLATSLALLGYFVAVAWGAQRCWRIAADALQNRDRRQLWRWGIASAVLTITFWVSLPVAMKWVERSDRERFQQIKAEFERERTERGRE